MKSTDVRWRDVLLITTVSAASAAIEYQIAQSPDSTAVLTFLAAQFICLMVVFIYRTSIVQMWLWGAR